MPLSIDNVVQSKTGSFEGTSGSATLDIATTAGNTVLILAAYGAPGDGTQVDISTPSGFTLAAGVSGPTTTRKAVPKAFIKANSAGGETSWSLTLAPNGAQVVWVALELTGVGLDPLGTWYVAVPGPSTPYDGATPTTQTSETTPTSACFDTLAFAIHACRSNDTTVVTWSGHTNGFTELTEVSHVNAQNAVSMSVSYLPSLALQAFQATGTLSQGSPATGTVLAIYADGAKHAPNIDWLDGAEMGTATTMSNGSPGTVSALWDTIVGAPEVISSDKRNYSDGVGGSYCYRLSATAAAEYMEITSAGLLGLYAPTSSYPWVDRIHLKAPTSLPGEDMELYSVDAGSTGTLTVWYRTASSKIGVKVGTGTEVLSDVAISADKWIGIDLRYDPRVANHLCDWQVDYDSLDATGPVAQTQAVGAGTSATSITAVRKGWHSARTGTWLYDDMAGSKYWGVYPIGDIAVLGKKVDPTGTPVLGRFGGGTPDSANFKTFVSNGTYTNWDGATARNNIDELPPVVGGSADGVAQVAFTAGQLDYAEFPWDSFTGVPGYVLRAARWCVLGWASAGQPGTFELRSYDGETEFTLIGNGDHGVDSSSTLWLCRMQRDNTVSGSVNFYHLTQARLDALALRFGFSNDAAPDLGILGGVLQLAIQPSSVLGVTDATAPFRMYLKMDEKSAAIRGVQLDTPPTGGATLTWTKNGTPGSRHIDANSTWTEPLLAESISDVTEIGTNPDPSG